MPVSDMGQETSVGCLGKDQHPKEEQEQQHAEEREPRGRWDGENPFSQHLAF